MSLLKKEFEKPYMAQLFSFLKNEEACGKTFFPPNHLTFNAFNQTAFHRTSVVIVGQDPYHGQGQAHGLSFSVCKGVKPPPSLQNIFRELKSDLGIPIPKHGCLLSWARQGVFLLNATLTVRAGSPRSHYGKGWETFTDAVISAFMSREDPLIFVLWGKTAQEKYRLVKGNGEDKQHYILTSSHPSPYSASAGFLGSKHFSAINKQLTSLGKAPIDWELR